MQQISKKVILVGHFGVGKSSLVRQFVYQKFSDEYLTTLGVKIDKKLVEFAAHTVNMIIWDVAGEVTQKKVPTSYYLGAHGIIYVFDLSRSSTFQNVKEDIDYLRKMLPQAHFCVVGNKRDLVKDEDIAEVKQSFPLEINFLTSARTGEHVEEMFRYIAEQMT